MIKRILSFFLIVISLAVVSCTRDNISQPYGGQGQTTIGRILYADFAESDTKIGLNEDRRLFWHNTDRISVFENFTAVEYKFNGEDGDVKGSFSPVGSGFTGNVEGYGDTKASSGYSKIYAVYPHKTDNHSPAEGTITVNFPAVQAYNPDCFDPASNYMVAVTESLDDVNLHFNNVGCYIIIKLYGGEQIRSVSLKGNSGEILCGPATISASFGEKPSVTMTGDGTEVTIDCGEEGILIPGTDDASVPFWFVLPPVTFENGFELTITNTDGDQITKRTAAKLALVRNIAQPIKALNCTISVGTDMTSFCLSDGANRYESWRNDGNEIYVSAPQGTDLSNLTAIFSHNGKSVTVNGEQQESGVNTHDFSDFTNPVIYRVTSRTGEEHNYSVVLFNLPVMEINTPGGQPIKNREDWIGGSSILIHNTDGTITDFGMTSIKGRGNATWVNYPKKPYALKLDGKKEMFGMPAHKRWCLLAGFLGFICNPITMEIANRAEAIDWNPQGTFLELILNGKYLGLYFLCEQIKVDKNRLNIQELSPTDLEEPMVTGGYLLEYDNEYDEQYKFRSSYFKNSQGELGLPIMLKSPDEDVPDAQFNYIKNFIDNFEALLANNGNAPDPRYRDYVDIDSFIDMWFVLETVGTYEAYKPRSVFMHKGRDGVDSPVGTICKLKAGPIWDQEEYQSPMAFRLKDAYYYKQFFRDPFFVVRVKEKWPEYRNRIEGRSEYNTSVLDYLSDFYRQIRQSALRDVARWDNQYFSPDNDVNRVFSKFSTKLDWMESQINAMVVNYDQKPGGNEDFDEQTGDGSGWTER